MTKEKYYLKNKEKIILYQKAYRKEHPERIKAYLEKNKQKIKERKKNYYQEKAQFVLDYKKNKGCSKCGWNKHPEILQFHHTKGDKSFSVGSAIGNKKNEVIKAEMDKCVLLCPNCHFLLHSKKDSENKNKSPTFSKQKI